MKKLHLAERNTKVRATNNPQKLPR